MDLWVADRTASGWSAFRPLPAPIVTDGFEIHPSASQAALFFAARRPDGLGGSDIYRVPRRGDDGWGAAEHLPAPVNDSLSQPDLYVAPDESFMLLVMTVRRDSTEHDDLFYVERLGDGWSVPRPLPPSVNTPGYEYGPWVTADGETLYFNSDRRGSADLYRVSMRALGLGPR